MKNYMPFLVARDAPTGVSLATKVLVFVIIVVIVVYTGLVGLELDIPAHHRTITPRTCKHMR